MVEARIVELRREHPGWGPRTLEHRLVREGIDPVPGRSSIYRCLIRHGLIIPEAHKRKRADYKRWERSRAMELWQMDVVGGVRRWRPTEWYRSRGPPLRWATGRSRLNDQEQLKGDPGDPHQV